MRQEMSLRTCTRPSFRFSGEGSGHETSSDPSVARALLRTQELEHRMIPLEEVSNLFRV